MIHILDRYIGKEFLKMFLLVLSVFIMIYLLVDVFEKIDDFLEAGIPYYAMVKYFVYKIPLIINQTEPVAILMSGLLTVSLLLRNNEMLAMQSMGRSLFLICRPILLGALALSLVSFHITEKILPLTISKVNYAWDVQVKHRQPRGFFGRDKFWFRGENAIYSIGSLHAQNSILKDVEIFLFDQQFFPKEIIYAEAGMWAGGSWQFVKGKRKVLGRGGDYSIVSFAEQNVTLSEKPADFGEMTKKTEEMSSEELSRYAQKIRGQGQDSKIYLVDLQSRFAYSIMGLVLLVLGIPALLSQRVKWSVALGITTGIVIVFVVWIIWHLSLTLGRVGFLSPYVAAWAPLLLAGALGLIGWRAIRQ